MKTMWLQFVQVKNNENQKSLKQRFLFQFLNFSKQTLNLNFTLTLMNHLKDFEAGFTACPNIFIARNHLFISKHLRTML